MDWYVCVGPEKRERERGWFESVGESSQKAALIKGYH